MLSIKSRYAVVYLTGEAFTPNHAFWRMKAAHFVEAGKNSGNRRIF